MTFKLLLLSKQFLKDRTAFETKEKNQLSTHSTWRDEILVNDMGIGPVRLLLLSRLSLHKIATTRDVNNWTNQETLFLSKLFNAILQTIISNKTIIYKIYIHIHIYKGFR